MQYKLEIRNVRKHFEEKNVLRNINLKIPKGNILTILGGSGTGKSVLLKIIIGLIKQDYGEIICDNKIIKSKGDLKNFHKKISVLFQNNALFDGMNIEKNILFPFINDHHYEPETLNKMCNEAIISVGLDVKIRKSATSEISGGMQKRVALARAIITKPEIIFLDEPTSGLDVENSQRIFELVHQLSKQYAITVIIITHDVFLSPSISDQIVFIENGEETEVDSTWIENRFKICQQVAKS